MKKTVNTISALRAAFLSGTPVEVEGLSGRLIRGNKPEDFLTLTNDKDRFVVLLIDSKTLSKLPGLTGHAMLKTVGYTDADIATEVVTNGNYFKLVLFPEGGDAVDATWDNMLDLVAKQYPRVAPLIKQHRAELKKSPSQVPFSWYEDQRGYKWADVRKAGKTDPRFMTEAKLLASKGTVVDLREFLYHVIHLRELYQGDGWLLNDKTGTKDDREVAVLNKPLSELGEHDLIDVSVFVPTRRAPSLMTFSVNVADHIPLEYVPEFWDPRKAYNAHYDPDIEAAKLEGRAYALKHGLEPAFKLLERPEGASLLFLTDLQKDFCDDGRLPVRHTFDVILRACARALNGFITGHYAGVKSSRDGHPDVHISFGTYFRTQNGSLFDLSKLKASILTLADDKKAIFKALCFGPDGSPIDMGYIQPLFNPKECVEYNKYLVATGQAPQWAFAEHCVRGTDGANLHPFLVETLAFCSGLRSFVPGSVDKGHIIDRDWFGPLCDCWSYKEVDDPAIVPNLSHPQAGFQKGVVDGFKPYRSVEFFGVAEDFCDYWMKRQAMWYFAGTEYLAKMRFVTDGTAAIIPGAKHVQEQNDKARVARVKFIAHDTPFKASL